MPRKNLPFKLLAWDTETIGLGGDAVFCSWCDGVVSTGESVNGNPIYTRTLTRLFIDEFLTEKYHEAVLIAHNGLRFDLLRLDWKQIVQEGFKARIFTGKSKNNIRGINIERGKHRWFIRDSLTFFPGTLKEFAANFSKEHFKHESPDWSKTKFNADNPAHVEYAIADSTALFHACKGFDDFARQYFSVSIMDVVTLSGLGYSALKHISKEKGFDSFPYVPAYFEKAVRSSYHGGFTSAFKVGQFRNLVYFDINSAYAHVMGKYPMPAGLAVCTTSKTKQPSLILASVDFKNSFPYLVSKPEQKFCASRYAGKLYGWYWDFEIDLQRKLGAEIIEHLYISWPETDSRQKFFINLCKKLRAKDYFGALGKFAKLIQNSVYGKHGTQKHEFSLIMSLDKPSLEAFPLLTNDGQLIEGLWEIPNGGNGNNYNSMVHWASYITARVRWQLMKYLMMVPQEDWIYCDTDSFIVPAKYKKVYKKFLGDEYGKLKIEGELSYFKINAPKTYQGVTKDNKNKDAAKGMPRSVANIAWRDGAAVFEGSISLALIMKGKLLNREIGRYTKKLERKLSGPTSIRSGKFIDGVWTPKTVCASFQEDQVQVDIPLSIKQKLKELHP